MHVAAIQLIKRLVREKCPDAGRGEWIRVENISVKEILDSAMPNGWTRMDAHELLDGLFQNLSLYKYDYHAAVGLAKTELRKAAMLFVEDAPTDSDSKRGMTVWLRMPNCAPDQLAPPATT